MKRAVKGKSTIYQFLEESGVLQGKTDVEIKAARKQYWKSYRTRWQREKRQEQREFTVSFTKKEMKTLEGAVAKHETSYTNFIKLAVLAYIQRKFITLYPSSVHEIRELLLKNYTTLQNIEEQKSYKSQEGILVKQMAVLESAILKILYNPISFEEAIRDAVENNPDARKSLLEIIKT